MSLVVFSSSVVSCLLPTFILWHSITIAWILVQALGRSAVPALIIEDSGAAAPNQAGYRSLGFISAANESVTSMTSPPNGADHVHRCR